VTYNSAFKKHVSLDQTPSILQLTNHRLFINRRLSR